MHIEDEKISVALKKIGVLREQLASMCIGKQGYALSVMDLHHVVEQVYGLKIEMIEVTFPGVYLRGNVERYADNHARILVRADLSDTEKRLAAVKELCHLALDEKDDWSSDGSAMLEAILAISQNSTLPLAHAPMTPIESEALALIAAGELMYPAEYRDADAAKIAAGETTILAIGIQHDVPPFVIERGLRQEARYKPLREAAQVHLGLAAE